MSDIDALLAEFVAAFHADGDADPLPFLRRAGGDRDVLAALIDGFLAFAPPPAFDSEAFAAARARPSRKAFVRRAVAGTTLIDLRHDLALEKAAVSERLAKRMGFAGRVASVKACYHEIETGQVDPARVREPVWEALAGIFGRAGEQVREAVTLAFESRAPSNAAFERSTSDAAAVPRPRLGRSSDPVRDAFFVD